MGRRAPAPDQLDASGSTRVARRGGAGRASSATRMTTRKTTEVVACRSTFQRTSCSTTPRPTPATKASGSDSMSATTAAARAGRRMATPAAASTGRPSPGALSMTVRAARAPVMTHTREESRCTGKPRRKARSALSAMPRMARPPSVRSRNQVRAPSTRGTTAMSSRSLPVRMTGSTATWTSLRPVAKLPTSLGESSQPGRNSSMPPSTWARPMVATVRARRGARSKRRMTSRSQSQPTAPPETTATATAAGQGQP